MNATSTIRVRNQIDALNSVAANGLPDCYDDVEEFFTDFWMDFSWVNSEMKEEVQAVLDSASFTDTHNTFNSWFKFDLREELVKGQDFDPDAPVVCEDDQ